MWREKFADTQRLNSNPLLSQLLPPTSFLPILPSTSHYDDDDPPFAHTATPSLYPTRLPHTPRTTQARTRCERGPSECKSSFFWLLFTHTPRVVPAYSLLAPRHCKTRASMPPGDDGPVSAGSPHPSVSPRLPSLRATSS